MIHKIGKTAEFRGTAEKFNPCLSQDCVTVMQKTEATPAEHLDYLYQSTNAQSTLNSEAFKALVLCKPQQFLPNLTA